MRNRYVVRWTVTEGMNQLPGAIVRRRAMALFNWRPLRRPTRALEDPTLMPWRLFISRLPRRIVAQLLLPRFGWRIGTGPRSIDEVRHVAVIHWDNLGDAVLLGPVLRQLRRNLPAARIVLIFNEKNHGIFAHCPYVDCLLPQTVQLPAEEGEPHGTPENPGRLVLDAARLLRTETQSHGPIDLVIGPDWLDPVYGATFFESALFRRGGGRRLLRGRARRGLATIVDIRRHHVRRNLEIAAALGVEVLDDYLEFWTSRADQAMAIDLLRRLDANRPIIAIAVGAGAGRKRWPASRFGQVAAELGGRTGAQILLVGGRDARVGADEIKNCLKGVVVDLVGETSIGVVGSVLRNVDLLVSNDSGLAHVAAAVGTPVVVVFAHPLDGEPWVVASPSRYRPWGVPSVVLQPPERIKECGDQSTCIAESAHCILTVPAEDVVEASMKLLAETRSTT